MSNAGRALEQSVRRKTMKRIYMIRLVLVWIILILIGVEGITETVKITHNKNINVRAKPSTESNVVGTAVSGEEYEYLGTAENGWLRIRLSNGIEGYVSGKMADIQYEESSKEFNTLNVSESRPINEAAEKSLNELGVTYRDIPAMPEPNIDKEITFKWLGWWSDYDTAAKIKEEYDFDVMREFFMRPGSLHHWDYAYSSYNSSRARSYYCGGELDFECTRYPIMGPEVAGHKFEHLKLFFLVKPELGKIENYKKKGMIQFYMGVYIFVSDYEEDDFKKEIYQDLEHKLTVLYGTPGHVIDGYVDSNISYWVNKENAAIFLCNKGSVKLSYMAPHAEAKLQMVENQMRVYGTPVPTPAPTPTPFDLYGL